MNEIIFQLELDDSKVSKIKATRDSEVYARELLETDRPGLYYPVSWKSYLVEENT